MKDNKIQYKHILKATSIFGGVQFFNVIISVAKSKIVAVLLGTSGVGILGILTSTLNLVLGISRMGLDFSLVKEISASKVKIDKREVFNKIAITKRLTWLTGLLGAFIILVISPLLSKIAFGNKDFTIYFIIISAAVFFNQITLGNMAILQGFNQLKKIAKSIILASFFALVFAAIIYYLFGQSGIPWVIVVTSVTAFLFSKYYASSINIDTSKISFRAAIFEGKSMLKLGFVLSLGTLASLLNGYLVQIFITNQAGVEKVGLYNAGFVLINSYVLLFFNALSKDFFPRLSEISSDNNLVKKMVNKQAITTLLLLTPIVVIFLVFKSFIVQLLYTEAFLPILGMISFGIVATIFKAVSWIMGFVIIAKNDSKLYVKVEVISNLVLFLMVVVGYHFYGITGAGLSYLVYYILYAILIKFVVGKYYQFKFEKDLINVIMASIGFCFTTLYVVYLSHSFTKLVVLSFLVLMSFIYTIYMFNRLIGIRELLKNK